MSSGGCQTRPSNMTDTSTDVPSDSDVPGSNKLPRYRPPTRFGHESRIVPSNVPIPDPETVTRAHSDETSTITSRRYDTGEEAMRVAYQTGPEDDDRERALTAHTRWFTLGSDEMHKTLDALPDRYNGFDRGLLRRVLNDHDGFVVFGREGSPVIYLYTADMSIIEHLTDHLSKHYNNPHERRPFMPEPDEVMAYTPETDFYPTIGNDLRQSELADSDDVLGETNSPYRLIRMWWD